MLLAMAYLVGGSVMASIIHTSETTFCIFDCCPLALESNGLSPLSTLDTGTYALLSEVDQAGAPETDIVT